MSDRHQKQFEILEGVSKGTAYLRRLSELASQIQVTRKGQGSLPFDRGIEMAVEMIVSLAASTKKAMLIGNGGSAALVSHTQNDLCAAVGVRAMVFHEASLLTALSNDHGYETVFKRLVKLWAEAGDVLIAVSSSGKSENILQAAQVAADEGCQVITLTGFQVNNPLRSLGGLNFYVPSEAYGFVEMTHMSILHALTDLAMVARYAEKKIHV